MFLSKIFTSFTFRFLVGYVAWLSLSVFMVLGVIYAFIAYDSFSGVHRSVTQELDELSQAYTEGGVAAADEFIRDHSGPERLIRFFYFVGDENRTRITGTLDNWPETEKYRDGWLGFDLQDAISTIKDPVNTEFIARSKVLASGEQVLVARHYADILTSTKLVAGALIQSMAVTIIIGTLGGAVATALSLRQIERINKTVRHIMSGDFSERIEDKGSRGDLRQLSGNINQMLDRIEVLMNGVRQVSDNIAHDLRTPLTRLRNRLSELYNETACPDAQGEVAALIEEADGLLGTFSALLRITQVESGNRRSGFADVDLCTLVSDVIELYEPLAMDKEQQLETGMAKVGAFHGDRNLLFQAVANLVDNAIKYTPEGGRVFVGLAVEPQHFKISVADSGVGIPEQDRDKVFQRFFRVESSRGTQPGNGLGLSLVQAVVRLHEGEISLEDNHPGLRVVIRLPRHTREEPNTA